MSGALTLVSSALSTVSNTLSNLNTPPLQKFRTIGFVLKGGAGPTLNFTFTIRPEDLRRSEPSRTSVQQTLGGALIDSFGAGLSTITLSGNNGWRGNLVASGEELFAELRAAVFTEWHKRRKQQIAAGKDPNAVQLSFVDTLDNITVYVAPQSFTLMRARNSPLLMRYSIELTVLGDVAAGSSATDSILAALSNPLRWLASVTGLGNDLGQLQSLFSSVLSAFAAAQAYIGPFMFMATAVLTTVQSLAAAASPGGLLGGTIAPVLSVGQSIAMAAANVFHALAANTSLTNQARGVAIATAQTFLDASCLIGNGFAVGQIYSSFDQMLGASACSSTGGGSDWSAFTLADANPFESYFGQPSAQPAITVTAAGQAALSTLLGDVLLLAAAPATVTSAATALATGVIIPGTAS